MRVALYNRYWNTLGGGEQLAAGIARALGDDHDVELLVHEPFDASVASERLGVALVAPQRVIDDGTRAFLEATAGYDLLVNTSFGSTFPGRARHSLYYVHFPIPHPPIDPPRGTRAFVARTIGSPPGTVEYTEGFWLPEFRGGGRWSHPEARFDLLVPRGRRCRFVLGLNAGRLPPGRESAVEVRVDGRTVFSGRLSGRRTHHVVADVVGRGSGDPVVVELRCDPFVPRLETGVADDRELGIVVEHAGFAGAWRDRAQRWSGRQTASIDLDFLASYDAVVANSPYTAEWVRRLWDREAEVLAPPVVLRDGGAKRSMILGVGRFFPDSSGHSKKQLELVEAFRRACDGGLTGWELCLAGGCAKDARTYVEEVRTAAVGLPVRFYVNARGEDLDELFAGASLFWHAAGFGEDPDRDPDRFEHFGISVIEGMSAGAVPVVFAIGGPAGIVEPGRTGEHFRTLDELAALTRALAADDGRRARCGAAAVVRARDFTPERFGARVRELVDTVGL